MVITTEQFGCLDLINEGDQKSFLGGFSNYHSNKGALADDNSFISKFSCEIKSFQTNPPLRYLVRYNWPC